jgi:hypothetical protein
MAKNLPRQSRPARTPVWIDNDKRKGIRHVVKLICPECQRENDAERIYCHDCGARLDRSAAASRITPKESLKETQRRVRNLFDPTQAKIRHAVSQFCKLVAAAFVLAAVVQIILPPDVPPPKKGGLEISQVSFDMENAITNHRPAQLQYSEQEADEHLSYVLKTKQSALNKPFLEFKRALAEFREGLFSITVERSLFGFSLYTSASYAVKFAQGKTTISSRGGSIGRLPIHPAIMQYMNIIFADLWSALDRDRKLVAKMAAIEFHDKAVTLVVPPPG